MEIFLQALIQVGIFATQAFLVFLVIAGVILLIASLAAKAALNKPEFEIKIFNEKLNKIKEALQEKILSEEDFKKIEKENKKNKESKFEKNLYVLHFEGDVKASATEDLREEITAILSVVQPQDEVLVSVESPGGMVHGYGLAASQLHRIRQANIPLTIAVDKVAASGGYLMACTANKILAAPFAILGSIGVVAQVPNVHDLLKKNNISYKEYTAGEYKRTVSVFGEITPKGEEKFIEQLESTHSLFKKFVSQFRPHLDLSQVATGEYWYGEQALALGLVDEIKTSDDYILELSKTHRIVKIKHEKPKKFADKFAELMGKASENILTKTMTFFEKQRHLS